MSNPGQLGGSWYGAISYEIVIPTGARSAERRDLQFFSNMKVVIPTGARTGVPGARFLRGGVESAKRRNLQFCIYIDIGVPHPEPKAKGGENQQGILRLTRFQHHLAFPANLSVSSVSSVVKSFTSTHRVLNGFLATRKAEPLWKTCQVPQGLTYTSSATYKCRPIPHHLLY
jgi:hypothetical protein